MINLTFEQINNRYDLLPEKLKEAIFSPSIDTAIIRLSQSYRLDNQKISSVAQNVGEILFGFENYKNLASDLQTDLNVDNRLATAIASDIVSKVLSPYRKELETAYSPIVSTSTMKPQEIKSSIPPIDLRLKTSNAQISTTPISPTPPTPVEGPAILFKSEAIASATPITAEKRRPTLGGLFGFSRRKETTPKEKIVAEIETPSQKPMAKPTIAKTEIPAFKVVHYSQFEPQKPANQKDAGPKMFVGQNPIAPTPPQPFKPKVISVTPIPPSPRIYPERKEITPTQINPTSLPIVPKAPAVPPKPSIPTIIPVELPRPPQQLPPAVPTPKSPEPTIATTIKEEEMVDLINLQKVKIKTEVEKVKPDINNGNIVNLKH